VSFEEALSTRLAGHVSLSPEQIRQLRSHFDELLKWNRRMNLTSITDAEEAVERHYCESLFLAAHLPAGGLRIVDIGSGAGFPGIPVAVYRPDCRVTLVESHQRKAVFLREGSRGLPNVSVLAERAEGVNEHFDWLISRAVAWKDLRPVAKLAYRFALLVAPPFEHEAGDIVWEDPLPLPWGVKRALLLGSCST
jgi:16S rRNA (guanine527-N7)-methyltransferase